MEKEQVYDQFVALFRKVKRGKTTHPFLSYVLHKKTGRLQTGFRSSVYVSNEKRFKGRCRS